MLFPKGHTMLFPEGAQHANRTLLALENHFWSLLVAPWQNGV